MVRLLGTKSASVLFQKIVTMLRLYYSEFSVMWLEFLANAPFIILGWPLVDITPPFCLVLHNHGFSLFEVALEYIGTVIIELGALLSARMAVPL